jgi:hypothetical protein
VRRIHKKNSANAKIEQSVATKKRWLLYFDELNDQVKNMYQEFECSFKKIS